MHALATILAAIEKLDGGIVARSAVLEQIMVLFWRAVGCTASTSTRPFRLVCVRADNFAISPWSLCSTSPGLLMLFLRTEGTPAVDHQDVTSSGMVACGADAEARVRPQVLPRSGNSSDSRRLGTDHLFGASVCN